MRDSDIKLEGREKDRVFSEYLEWKTGARGNVAPIVGRRGALTGVSILLAPPAAVLLTMLLFDDSKILQCFVVGFVIVASLALAFVPTVGINRRLWRAAMRTCGHDVCCGCGYWLERRATGSRACPECGLADAEQPVPLGSRREPSTWPRFDVEQPAEPDAREAPEPPKWL